MTSMREDARRALAARRERAFSRPAPLLAPLAATVAVAGAVVLLLLLLGAGAPVVVAGAAAVAVAGLVLAHRTTASVAAGISLLLIRPYQPGERVRLYLPERASLVEAEIVRIGLLNTLLASEDGLVAVANTRMLRAAPECRAR
ncbi:hypothetical protein [Jatrophihabitans fulvus]